MTSPLDIAAQRIRHWRENPVAYVEEEFGVTPDPWQAEALMEFAKPGIKRISMQACVGPGKSALLAWMGWNFLTCYGYEHEHPKGACVAVTRANLRDNLWSEYSKWQQACKSGFLQQAFTWTADRIYSNDHPETWWLSARTFSKDANVEEQGNSLSGLHSQYVLAQIDESGTIPPVVLKRAEQALSNCTVGCIAQAGNPESRDGMLYTASTTQRSKWHITEITGDPEDPKRSARVDIDWAKEMIETYGREDPWVMMAILGRFPQQAFNQLLTLDEVTAAIGRKVKEGDYNTSARVMGVDVARQGTDRSVIFPRQGIVGFPPKILRGANGADGAGWVARKWNEWDAHACFIDSTGGWAGSWIDHLREIKYQPHPVEFAGQASSKRFKNKRAEMWWEMAQWVKRGGALPSDCPDLVAELVEPRYTYRGDSMLMEDKEQIRSRIGRSPDLADALCLTFALPISPPELKLHDPLLKRRYRRAKMPNLD